MSVLKYVVSPGDLAAEVSGLTRGSESRQILRMFVNTLVWGAVGVIAAVMFAL
ncbi:MAG: hypothetical protein KIT16_07600 [Rhodospirillaceae bacterium]|nr:hypothetical protein [Rhodospirillaceae bacterium]